MSVIVEDEPGGMAVACADYADYAARVSRAVAGHARSVAAGDAMGIVDGELVHPLPSTFDAFLRTVKNEIRGRFSGAFWDAAPVRVSWTVRGARYSGIERRYAVADTDDFESAFDAAWSGQWGTIVDLFAVGQTVD